MLEKVEFCSTTSNPLSIFACACNPIQKIEVVDLVNATKA